MQDQIQVFFRLLRFARFKNGKSIKEVALEIGVPSGRVSHWEDGSTFPKQVELDAISTTYGIDIKQLHVAHENAVNQRVREKEAHINLSKKGKYSPSPSEMFGCGLGPFNRSSPHMGPGYNASNR